MISKFMKPPVFSYTLFHVLNKQHRHRAEGLAKALEQIKGSECMERIVEHVVQAGLFESDLPKAPLCRAREKASR